MTDSLSTAVYDSFPPRSFTISQLSELVVPCLSQVHTAFTLMVFRSPYLTWSFERRNFETSDLDNSCEEDTVHIAQHARLKVLSLQIMEYPLSTRVVMFVYIPVDK